MGEMHNFRVGGKGRPQSEVALNTNQEIRQGPMQLAGDSTFRKAETSAQRF